jgi:hypothetical protein
MSDAALDAPVQLLYFEKQRSALCGVHALNTLLQARLLGARARLLAALPPRVANPALRVAACLRRTPRAARCTCCGAVALSP